MSRSEHDPQSRILRTFTVLHSLRPDWAGAFILNLGLDPAGAALSFAANIAGAACLSIESDPALLRNAQRTGSCDFVVNTLDEALRAMKNELRKRHPLSVGLEGDPATLLAEIVERGLAPQLFTAPTRYPAEAAHFQSHGALLLSLEEPFATPAPTVPTDTPSSSAAQVLQSFLDSHSWQFRAFTFNTTGELRAFDALALSVIPSGASALNRLRRQWLLSAARILPRDRHRALWLTPPEDSALRDRIPI